MTQLAGGVGRIVVADFASDDFREFRRLARRMA